MTLLAFALAFCLCLPAFADEGADQVATSDEYGGREAISADGMVEVTGDQVADGTYDVLVETDTQMFNIIDCQLTVKDGTMTAVVTLSGDGYQWLYMGTGEEAAAADSSDYIDYVEDDQGRYTYDIGEVPSLNTKVKCSCYSKRREQWYDHDIIFVAGTLPTDALSAGAQQAVRESTPLSGLADGDYNIAVDVSGGTDTVESPAPLKMADGQATATLKFSSPDYDYLVITGEKYEPTEVTDDSATYEVPVKVFDTAIPVTFDSTASGSQEETTGSLSFHSGQLTDSSGEKVALDASGESSDDAAGAEATGGDEAGTAGNAAPVAAIVIVVVAACVVVIVVVARKRSRKDSEGK